MAYQISYAQKMPRKRNFVGLQTGICLFFLIFCLSVRLLWPEGAELLGSWLGSDRLSYGAEAVLALVTELEDGETVGEAVAVFCRELVHGGQ